MATDAATRPEVTSGENASRRGLRRLLFSRLWLPRPLYAAIPWIYLGSGCGALLGGLFLPDWAWTVPYGLLFGLASLHLGIGIASMRHRPRGPRVPDGVP